MLPLNPRRLHRFFAGGQEADAEGRAQPCYLLAPLTVEERTEWLAQLMLAGAMPLGRPAMFTLMRAGVAEIGLSPQAVDGAIACIDDIEQVERVLAEPRQDGETLPPLPADLVASFDRLAAYLQVQHPPLARAVKANFKFQQLGPRYAARLALRGWSDVCDHAGTAVGFERDNGEVPDALLDRLPPGHLYLIGAEVMRLMLPQGDAEKNFASPSGSPDGRKNSSAPTSAPDGSSASAIIH